MDFTRKYKNSQNASPHRASGMHRTQVTDGSQGEEYLTIWIYKTKIKICGMATLLYDLAPASLCQNTLLIYTAFPLCATVPDIFSLHLALLAAFAQQVFSPLVTKHVKFPIKP